MRTLNERALATGGALYRPQNKSYQSQRQGILQTNTTTTNSNNNDSGENSNNSDKGVPSTSPPPAPSTAITALQGFEHRPFVDFLQHCQLSSHLQRVITHALCLHARLPYPTFLLCVMVADTLIDSQAFLCQSSNPNQPNSLSLL